jgi:hypothetical protein
MKARDAQQFHPLSVNMDRPHAYGQGRGDRRERHRRDTELLYDATGTLVLSENQQPAGEAYAGDTATNTRGGCVPGSPVGTDTDCRLSKTRRSDKVETKRYLQMNKLAEVVRIA